MPKLKDMPEVSSVSYIIPQKVRLNTTRRWSPLMYAMVDEIRASSTGQVYIELNKMNDDEFNRMRTTLSHRWTLHPIGKEYELRFSKQNKSVLIRKKGTV